MNTDSITIIERQPVEYVENNRVYTLDELREMFGSVPGNVVVPLLDIITRLRTALAASQKTVRVLGEECRATRLERERFFDKSSHAEWAESVRLAGEAIMSTNADPAARAAVEGKAPNAH